MSHLVSALLLFTLTSPTNFPPASLPDAPEPHLQTQEPAAPASTPSNPTPDPHWLKVEQLPPGKAIAVLEHGGRYPTSCKMDLSTDTTLTCIQPMPYSQPRRLVFPRGNIASVFSEEVRYGPSLTTILVGTGIGAALGVGVFCSVASVRTILACSLLGGGIGAGVALTPPPFPRPPRTRRRLVYRAP